MEIEQDFNQLVGIRIREIRDSLHLTREKFSELCGISESFLAAVENGKKSVTTKTLYKICGSAGCSADYIIFGRDGGARTDHICALMASMTENQQECAMRMIEELSHAIRGHASERGNTVIQENTSIQKNTPFRKIH